MSLLTWPEIHPGSIQNTPSISKGWSSDSLRGRLIELSGWKNSAGLSLSQQLVLEMQQQKEAVAWITTQSSCFFPPDLAANGVDLAALPVLWLPDLPTAATACERLLRSGAFGLTVLDLGGIADLPLAIQTRLAALAKKHDCIVLFITEKATESSSLGSLISARLQSHYRRSGEDCFLCALEALKDKRQAPGWKHVALYRGPEGLH